MKNAICALAFAGLVGSASAHEFSLSVTNAPTNADNSLHDVTVTVEIVGDANVGTHMLGGSFSLQSDSAAVRDISWHPASWSAFNTDGGYAGSGNYNPVIFGQLVIFGVPPFDVPAVGSELGGFIGSFQIVIRQGAVGVVDLRLVAEDPFSLEVIDMNGGETFQSSAGNLTLNGATILVIPSPSSLALIGLGGLAATRRRR